MCVFACISFPVRKLMKFDLSLEVLLDQYERIYIWLTKSCDNDTVQIGVYIPIVSEELAASIFRVQETQEESSGWRWHAPPKCSSLFIPI